MTKKRNLTTFMIAIMIMLFSLPANAQGTVGYAKWEGNTLIFYGGESVPEGAFALNTDNEKPGWLSQKSSCTKVVFDESFKNVRPTSCYRWFFEFSQLKTIEGIENLNTEKVTDMSNMFYDCQSLNSLDVSKFNTAKVVDMEYMFSGCKGLTSLDVSKFNTAEVENMCGMFNGCSGLTSLDLSSFNTTKVTGMSDMFRFCSSLTSLDLSSFNTAEVGNMDYMFDGCSGLTKIYVSDDFKIGDYTNGQDMFSNCTSLNGKASYSKDNTGIDMANYKTGYFTKSNLTPYVKWNGDTNVLTFKVANYTEGTNGEYILNESAKDPGWSTSDVYNNCTKVVFTTSFKQAKLTSCYGWFNNFTKLTTIEGIENLNTEEVTNMSYMFNYCSAITSLNLSSFNTANVKNMGYMFSGCYGLISLDLSSFNTAKVENMTNMFDNCYSLTTIYASDGFTTGEIISSDGMFWGCLELEGATPWDIAKTGIEMANFDGYFTPKTITPYVKWDANTKVLTFKVANNKEEGAYDLNEGENKPKWVDEVSGDCKKVVFTPSFKQARPTSCYMWFWGFWPLTTIEGIENLNTEKVTDMSEMFNGCKGLISLDLSSFNTANVEDMTSMFTGCNKLTSLNLSNFNTANVTDMSNMFADCQGLTSLDLSSFNTAKVEDMSSMFNGCSGLTKIYVGDGFTTGTGTNGSDMFYNCTSLVGAVPYDNRNTDLSMANYKTGYFKTYFTLGENKVELCGNPLTTESLDLSGDYDFTPKYEFKANEATYSRDLSTSGSTWFSLCLPFAYTPDNFNFTAYKLMSATADAVEIEEITETIAAGTPVLFKFKDDVVDVDKKIEIFATGANIVNAPVVDGSTAVNGPNGSSLQLCGTYQTKTFSSEDNNAFILLNDKLMNPAKMLDTGVTKVGVKPFRAYMTLTASAQTSSARAFSIGHGGEEGTAAIDLLNSVATDDAEYYDINGRRIDAPAKGVNIVRRGNKTIKLIIK